jgi:SSS family solute:Na+ symporter
MAGDALIGGIDLAVLVGYFAVVIGFGAWAARHSRGTRDFFLGGQRFAWWLVALSCIATIVGSYSFVKYSAAGFSHGLSSSQTYLNDWFWMPLWMFGWLPIVYYNRITSVPEYFERRFGPHARAAAMVLLLVYLLGYLGINFLTMGKALQALTGLDLLLSAAVAAIVCGVYTSHGGQTAVIFTDLLQGAILLVAGLLLFGAGLVALGGPGEFWAALDAPARRALPFFAEPPEFNFVGIFWQDGMLGGIAFYFMNQGILLRFLSARSVGDARKAIVFVLLVLMPIAAIAVSGGGWIGRALVDQGQLPSGLEPDSAFVIVAQRVLPIGLFGFVVAALVAALMSTADTLINAIATITVVDFWRPWRRSRSGGRPASERHELRAARTASAIATVVGFGLVPVFATFGTIYWAHGAFTAAVTPPLAVALVLGFSWRRFGGRAALLVMLGGTALIALSFGWTGLVAPFAHGIPLVEGGKAYAYVRALYGLVVCLGLGLIGAALWPARTRPDDTLLVGPVLAKQRRYKGRPLARGPAVRGRLRLGPGFPAPESADEDPFPAVRLAAADAERLAVADGDLVTVRDAYWLRGGYEALTGRAVFAAAEPGAVQVEQGALARLGLRPGRTVVVERRL